VADEAARQRQLGDRREDAGEIAMQRRLTAGEGDLLDAHGLPGIANDAREQLHREVVRALVVQRVVVAQAVAAVQVADVGQLDRQAARPVVR
jgi:hypothetical protein